MLRLTFTFLACLCLWHAQAITFTFSGTIDSDWENSSNWDAYPGTTINAGDVVIINASCSFDNFSIPFINNGQLINNSDISNFSLGFINNGILDNFGDIFLDGIYTNSGITNNHGTLHITMPLSSTNTSSGVINNMAGASFVLEQLINNGLIENDGDFIIMFQLTNAGTINNRSNFSALLSLENTATGIINNTNLLDTSDLNNFGFIQNNGMIFLQIDSNSSGIIQGIGGINDPAPNTFTNTGIISPGTSGINSTGILTISSEPTLLTASSILEIEIGGTTAGTDYDVLNGDFDPITVGGTLNITSLGGFIPNIGDCFIIIEAEGSEPMTVGITGTFATVNLFPLPADRQWEIYYNDNDVTICVESIIPVELGDFALKLVEESVLLHWETFSELDNKGFEVQRSANGKDFATLDFVIGQGTSLEQRRYQYLDEQPLKGDNYYRLKQIDFDNTFDYSATITTYFGKEKITLYPNPVAANANLQLQAPIGHTYEIINPLGQVVKTGFQIASNTTISTQALPKGNYTLRIRNANEKQNIPFIIQ